MIYVYSNLEQKHLRIRIRGIIMSALNHALSQVRFRIPKQILEVVFTKRAERWRQTPMSTEDHVLNEVLRPRVLVDCNLVGGAEVFVPLDGLQSEVIDVNSRVYRVPKELTQGRSIMSVLSISYVNPAAYSLGGMGVVPGNSTMLRAGESVMNAMSSMPLTSNANVQLIGENVVLVKEFGMTSGVNFLRCIVAHDENMSHLQLRSHRAFGDLCVLAVKAYIYNEYIIQLDVGELHGGQTIGKFKEIIEGYADSEELYSIYLTEKWAKASFQNDIVSNTRLIKSIMGGNR